MTDLKTTAGVLEWAHRVTGGPFFDRFRADDTATAARIAENERLRQYVDLMCSPVNGMCTNGGHERLPRYWQDELYAALKGDSDGK